MSRTRGYSGTFTPRNKSKYVGSKKRSIIYRSLWERSFCKWCDSNNNVLQWAIEPFPIDYYDKGTNKQRKYYPDFFLKMSNGKKYIIEVKPEYQTKPPKMKKGSKKCIIEEETYMTNTSKWETAQRYCDDKGWEFKIVTEHTMKSMGIKIITNPPAKKKKGVSKKKVKYSNRKTSSGLNK